MKCEVETRNVTIRLTGEAIGLAIPNDRVPRQSGMVAVKAKVSAEGTGMCQHGPRLATKEEASKLDRRATEIIKTLKVGWLALALVVQEMIETNAFRPLGFPSMRAWMVARLGDQMDSAYRALSCLRALNGVSPGKLEKIGTRNALLLKRLPEKQRKSDEWLTKAATLPEKELRIQVNAVIEEKTGMPTEHFRHWGEAVPESVAQKLEEMMAKIGRVLGIDVIERAGRITALEALAALVLTTPDEVLKAEAEGNEAA